MMDVIAKPLPGVQVLLVDDDEDTRDLFAMVLGEAGAEVRTASDAKEAMRTVLQWRPCVIASDLTMPTMDGFLLLRELRSVDQLAQIPAIAFSGLSRTEDRAAALAAGFQELVSKPLEPDELVAAVQRWSTTTLAPP